jgi:GTP-binding protein Era
VAIVGKPNAGKSTLLNALVGQKLAIVTAKPQTTRHRILGLLSGAAHQAVLVDTPGVMAAARVALDAAMMRSVRTALTQADVLCAVVDAAAAAAADDPSVGLEGLAITGETGGPPLLVLLNKCDLLPPAQAEAVRAYFAAQPGVSAVLCASAATGDGVPQLESWLISQLPLGPALYPKDMVSEHPERFFVAEIVRERIFELYRQEIPYCCTVSVTEHKERVRAAGDPSGPVRDYIKVRIAVERESQKPILLGKGGAAIKALGTSSRIAIQEFLQRPVFLELRVEVAAGWRDSAEAVDRFGVNNPNQLST